MSIFSQFFGGNHSNENQSVFWNTIESEEDLKEAIQKSFEKKTIIFKHSTRCGISRMVLKNFEKERQFSEKDAHFYLLDLLNFRSISNKIEAELGVTHQSPQMIVIDNGKVANHASHQSISLDLV